MKERTIKIIQIAMIMMAVVLIELGIYILINHVAAAFIMSGLDLIGGSFLIEWLEYE